MQDNSGDGTNDDSSVPIQIVAGTEPWVAIAAGLWHSVALQADGTLWAWGYNQYGQLGDASDADKNTPVLVGADDDWVSVCAGAHHTLALKSNGELYAWGLNLNGQLGIIPTPIAVPLFRNFWGTRIGWQYQPVKPIPWL